MQTSKYTSMVIIVATLILFTGILTAQTVNWLGGNGDWMDATNWDTGLVPTSNEEAYILSGTVKIRNNENAVAKNVVLQSAGILKVRNGGTLHIANAVDAHGLLNEGRVYIWGKLTIETISSVPNGLIRNGIQNEDYFYVGSAGLVEILDIPDGNGILNKDGGLFLNNGQIDIKDTAYADIDNHYRFRNRGTIAILDLSTFGLTNEDNFINYAAGTIEVEGSGSGIGINNTSSGLYKNHGIIEVTNTYQAISNNNTFVNYSTGNIDTYDSNKGLNHLNGTFENHGDFYTHSCNTGFTCYSDLINEGFLVVATSSTGLSHKSGTVTNNNGLVLNGSTFSLNNNSHIINNGYLELRDKFKNDSAGSIENNGFCTSYYTSIHSLNTTSSFINYGVLEDHHNSFSGTNLDNQQVVVGRIVGPMENGVIFSNPIEVVSTSNITISDWNDNYTGPIINVAGVYDLLNNEFTPNSYAIDLSILYITININGSGLGRRVRLYMDNPVLPLIKPDYSQIKAFARNKSSYSADKQLVIYPNPSAGIFNLRADFLSAGATEIQVYNAVGQLVGYGQPT